MNEEMKKQRQKLTEEFLVQLEIRRRLETVSCNEDEVHETCDDLVAREECARHVRPFDKDVAVGQVRVLAGTERVTYVLVARSWGARSWLVIPFSCFSTPAFEAELKMKVDGGARLEVAQLWNARSLSTKTLEKSWVAGALEQELLEDVLSAWEWSVGLADLTADQLSRTGTPIRTLDDVRRSYQDAELKNFAAVDAADLRGEMWRSAVDQAVRAWVRRPFRRNPVFEPSEAMAAAPVQAPVSATCRVEGFEGSVRVRYTPADRTLRVQIFDAEGNVSRALDGWSVLAGGDEPCGEIAEGRFMVVLSDAFDGAVALVDPEEGCVCPLVDGEEQ